MQQASTSHNHIQIINFICLDLFQNKPHYGDKLSGRFFQILNEASTAPARQFD